MTALVKPLATADAQWEDCARLLTEWSARELALEDQQFGPIHAGADNVATTDSSWSRDPDRLSRLDDLIKARNRLCHQRLDREVALLRGIAGAVALEENSAAILAIRAQMEGHRIRFLAASLPGANVNLAESLDHLPVKPSGDVISAYFLDMYPRWVQHRRAWESVLENMVDRNYGYGMAPGSFRASERWGSSALGIQLANELWAERLGSEIGGEEGARAREILLEMACPGRSGGWICTFDSTRDRAETATDPEMARQILENWRLRSQLVLETHWNEHRTQLANQLKRAPARVQLEGERLDRLLQAITSEAVVYTVLLEDLGCDVSNDPCILAIRQVEDDRQRQLATIERIKAERREHAQKSSAGAEEGGAPPRGAPAPGPRTSKP
jgi:hypothetical protein